MQVTSERENGLSEYDPFVLLLFALLRRADSKIELSVEEVSHFPPGWSNYFISMNPSAKGALQFELHQIQPVRKGQHSEGIGRQGVLSRVEGAVRRDGSG